MCDDDPQSGPPNRFNEAYSVGPHVGDPPVEREEVGAEGMADVQGDGVQPWGPERSTSPKSPGVCEGVAETEQDEATCCCYEDE